MKNAEKIKELIRNINEKKGTEVERLSRQLISEKVFNIIEKKREEIRVGFNGR
jgi:hypothetical protein